jgi:transposase
MARIGKNKYIIHSRISEKKFREILMLFCLDVEATKISEITKISRPTINRIFDKIRQRIYEDCQRNSPLGNGSIEIDESYFGARRAKGKRGRGAQSKTPVFGMLKRDEKVYTQIVNNCFAQELLSIIQEQAYEDATLYTDGFKTYDGLADYWNKRHYRIKHRDNDFANGHNHINGIENFWGLCKVRLSRFRGIHKHKFHLHLKECEFRYNFRKVGYKGMYKYLLKIIRENPLKLS